MYFWAIFGPVYKDLISAGRLSLMIMSMDLAMLGGLMIHKLSSAFFSL
jgi:hypothetical protein